MENNLANFIWKVADLLRGPYRPNQYKDVMLPLTVLRRLDWVLEPTKDRVLERSAALLADGRLKNIDPILVRESGVPFYNTSRYTFERLKAVGVPGIRVGISPRGLYHSVGIPGTGIYSLTYAGTGLGRMPTASSSAHGSGAIGPRDLPTLEQVGLGSDRSWILYVLAAVALCTWSVQGALVALILSMVGFVHQRDDSVRLGRLYRTACGEAGTGDYSAAVDLIQQVNRERPSKALHLARDQCYLRKDDLSSAAEQYSLYEAAGGQLGHYDVLIYATVLGANGQAASGLAKVESLAGSPAGDIHRIAVTGQLLLELGRVEQAVEVLKQAPLRQRRPDEGLTHVRLLLAEAYSENRQRAKALTMYRRVYADDPDLEGVRDRIAQLEAETVRRTRN